MKKILILFLLCFIVVASADNDWKLIKDKGDVFIYSLQKPSYKLKHFKAKTTLNKNFDTVLAALQDTESCTEWVYNCVSNNMVEMIDFRKRIYHTIIHSPLFFKDREFYLESNVVYDPKQKSYTVTFASKPEYRKQTTDKFRVKDVEMNWNLKYLKEEETLVTYQVYIDPKLPIKTINNAMIKKSIFQTMLGLQKLVEKSVYAETKYSKSEREMLTVDK